MVRPNAEQAEQTELSEALMREVGAQLRTVRLERGEDLDEVADYLRIKPIYLYGIERGDMSVMPGRTYALGFLRTYADHLGFDGEDLIAQIKSTVDNLTGKTRFHLRAPLPENRLPKMPLLVFSLALLGGIYAGWAFLSQSSDAVTDEVPEVPASLSHLQQPVPAPAMKPAGPAPAAQPAGTAADRSGGAGARGGSIAAQSSGPASAPPPEPAVGARSETDAAREQLPASRSAEDGAPPSGRAPDPDIATIEPAAGPEARATAEVAVGSAAARGDASIGAAKPPVPAVGAGAADGADAPGSFVEQLIARTEAIAREEVDGAPQVLEMVNRDARVVIRATGPSWVQIRSLSGDYLRTRTLQQGDTFLVPNRDDLRLWTGNAGAVEYVVDGEVIRPLGPDGSVMRDIPLDPEGLVQRALRSG